MESDQSLRTVEAADEKRLRDRVVVRALALEFPGPEAELQQRVAVHLGRYAELFAYADDTGILFLEPQEAATLR